jgi:hypothetical protein
MSNPNTVQVRMRTHIAFADGRSIAAGKIAHVTERQARHLIECGAADPVAEPAAVLSEAKA